MERLLNESVECVCQATKVPPSLAKVLLHTHNWQIQKIIAQHQRDSEKLLKDSKIATPLDMQVLTSWTLPTFFNIILIILKVVSNANKTFFFSNTSSLIAQAQCNVRCVCRRCLLKRPMVCRVATCAAWTAGRCISKFKSNQPYQQVIIFISSNSSFMCVLMMKVFDGMLADIECMGKDCDILIPEDFVLNSVTSPKLRDKYQKHAFSDFVAVSSSTPWTYFCLFQLITWFRLTRCYASVPVRTALWL